MALICCCRRPPAYSAVDPTDTTLLIDSEPESLNEDPPKHLTTASMAQIPAGGCVYCGRRAPLIVGHSVTVERRLWLMLPREHYIQICACSPVHVGCVIEYTAGFACGAPRECARCHEPLCLPRALVGDRTADQVVLPADAEPEDAPDQWPLTTQPAIGRPWRGLRIRDGFVDIWPCDGAPQNVPPDLHPLVNIHIVTDTASDMECLGVEWSQIDHLLEPPKID